jgi:MFS transporter, OFA family, oxalate/formate antiporter
MGAIVTTFPISASIDSSGYQTTLLLYGMIFGVVGVLAAQGLRPAPTLAATPETSQSGLATGAMLKHPIFWLMFLMMSLMSTSGLMVISQMDNFAADFGVAKMMVWGLAALPLALTLDRFTNGLTRAFFGWLSDRIGRENTMFLRFLSKPRRCPRGC